MCTKFSQLPKLHTDYLKKRRVLGGTRYRPFTVNLDALTYAGNLENLKGVEGDSRHVFVQGDICDKELVSSLFQQYDFDYVINFAAESHVDRSIANPESI